MPTKDPAQKDGNRGGWTPRQVVLVGLGLFLLAWLLGGVGETQGIFGLVPFADIALGLGFALALFGAIVAGTSLWEIIPVGVLSGVGLFYKGQDHDTHVLSGWGLGLEHRPHILLGLMLIGVATAIAASLSWYHTRGGNRGRTDEGDRGNSADEA